MGNERDIFKPTTDDFNYDINQHANDTLGPVKASPPDGTEQERQNDHLISSLVTGKTQSQLDPIADPDSTARGKVDQNQIQSDSPYTIYGSEETKDGTRVYVDKYPTQTVTTDAEKQFWKDYYGNLTGTTLGGLGIVAGAAAGSPWAAGGNASLGYEIGSKAGSWVTGKILDTGKYSMPVFEKNGAKYIKVTP